MTRRRCAARALIDLNRLLRSRWRASPAPEAALTAPWKHPTEFSNVNQSWNTRLATMHMGTSSRSAFSRGSGEALPRARTFVSVTSRPPAWEEGRSNTAVKVTRGPVSAESVSIVR